MELRNDSPYPLQIGAMAAHQKTDVAQILRFGADEFGGNEIFHRRAGEMQPAHALDQNGFKRSKLCQSRLDELQIWTIGFWGLFGIEEQANFFRSSLEFSAVVITRGFPDVEVGGSASIHAAKQTGSRTNETEPERSEERRVGKECR